MAEPPQAAAVPGSARIPAACDLLVIGGGIHGAGIARDAAGRGLSVVLCERGDLAGETSSASSKLIHGGLRYLERLDLRLVREALSEREVLLSIAPHLVQPLAFVLPVGPGSRPGWMLRLGLFLYDRLGGRVSLPASRAIDLRGSALGAPLVPECARGFVYADCRADDARLVIANARSAAALGAIVLPRTEAVSAARQADHWSVALRPAGRRRETSAGAPLETIRARAIVNAAGPWVEQVLGGVAGLAPRRGLRLVKGSHIVVPRLYEGGHAFLLQQPDRRVVFLIPIEEDFTVIGTTDVPQDQPGPAALSDAERDYLCAAANRFLRRPVGPADVVWSWSGTRSLADDGAGQPSTANRDDVLDLDDGGAPLLSVYGGKLTTYRRMAERALARLMPLLMPGRAPPGAWTATAPLPGGEAGDAATCAARLVAAHPGLPAGLLAALARRHGSEAAAVLGGARAPADLGRDFGGGLHERELRWMMDREWAVDGDDAIWRRSKTGLRMTVAQRQAVAEWMAASGAAAGAAAGAGAGPGVTGPPAGPAGR